MGSGVSFSNFSRNRLSASSVFASPVRASCVFMTFPIRAQSFLPYSNLRERQLRDPFEKSI